MLSHQILEPIAVARVYVDSSLVSTRFSTVLQGHSQHHCHLCQLQTFAVALLQVGYLQGCHWDAATNKLMLVAGTEGAVGFFPLHEQPGPAREPAMQGATMHAPVVVLQGMHTEVVRTVHCFSANTQVSCGTQAQPANSFRRGLVQRLHATLFTECWLHRA